ncbi:MAG: group II intron reverse transcriptase/maturase [Chitinophagaceae bacterium]
MEDSKAKAWPVTKPMVWQAYKEVKVGKGSAGVDDQNIEDFEKRLADNLYRLWNRMSSGSYFPPPVKLVQIPKEGGEGKVRNLGVPTVSDRIAQTVVKDYLEPKLDPLFHDNSYGYRPGRSAHGALEKARKNCWQYDWVIDLDIKGFFDHLDHELVMKALRKHTQEKWVLTYVQRWLTAPLQDQEGHLQPRDKGSPQGSCVSPILANLFLHYGFDQWMAKEFKTIEFERYADDIIVHCVTERQAEYVLGKVKERLNACKLEVNPEKTKIIYCRDSNRKATTKREVMFTFLGFDFKPRECVSKSGVVFYSFTPAISGKARKKITSELRIMKLHRKTRTTLQDIAEMINSKMRGWINYYGKFRRSALRVIFLRINESLLKWVRSKYKSYRYSKWKAIHWLKAQVKAEPAMFVHWKLGFLP